MAKKQKEIVISTARPARKRTIPKTAFRKGGENPHAFQPGECGRNRAKKPERPDDERLISRALRAQLSTRAPNERAIAVGLRPGASWAQVCAAALLDAASRGDVAASKEVRESTEGGRLALAFDSEPGSEDCPLLEVCFVSPEYRDGQQPERTVIRTDSEGRVIKGPLPPRLIEGKLEPREDSAPAPAESEQWPAPVASKPHDEAAERRRIRSNYGKLAFGLGQ